MAERSPADFARDTLKLLAARRLQPTPANYQAIYEEVAGQLPHIPFPKAPLRRIATVLPSQTPAQKRITKNFSQAIEDEDWTALQSAIADFAKLDVNTSAPPVAPPALLPQTIDVLPPHLAHQLVRLIETIISAFGEEEERMYELSQQLVSFLQKDAPPVAALEQMLSNYSYRLSFTAEDQAQRRLSIHALLRMVGEHIVSIASHDEPLQKQAQALSSAMEKPWTLRQLDAMQTHLKSLLFRHLEIDSHRNEAHQQLKDLLAEHTHQMASLGKLSEHHAHELHDCAQRIQQAQDLGDLAMVLQSVVQSGSALATENRMVQAQLADLREQTEAQEHTIEELSISLSHIEDSTRHDPETGTLNLLGFHDALMSEAARSHRQTQPISLAALQVDHLAAIGAEAGPTAVSAALIHMARLIRSTLRPQDAAGRTSPTQFSVLFPGTKPAQAAQALARLQAAISERPLLHADRRWTLSFSAGVIALNDLDTPAQALARAAHACEQAQHMGMGRVALS